MYIKYFLLIIHVYMITSGQDILVILWQKRCTFFAESSLIFLWAQNVHIQHLY